ncbi:iron-containing alcohol dehydrogenase [Thiohalomonas denitrificans]|nr:iron-containing alcohol dehydrogenase [Thiohalomonas denitrificans]
MMKIDAFTIGNLPRIVFGDGRLSELPGLISSYGDSVLLVMGGKSFRAGPHWEVLKRGLVEQGVRFECVSVEDEPSPRQIDDIVSGVGREINVVAGIGGGSVLDAAKAIAALLPRGNSVFDHLEDVGRGLPYEGTPLPLVAVPTTAGTGSEATKNAVLSQRGTDGFKKSFRDDSMVARVALIDPMLLAGCPRELMAAQGMDAFTQLIESYVSRRANPVTDALAWSGLEAVAGGFFDALQGGEGEAARSGRAAMAYGALISGITLAQVGLGSVHGLAQPFGSLFPIPHGVACGTVLAAATEVNVHALEVRDPEHRSLQKYAAVGRLLSGGEAGEVRSACRVLVKSLEEWTRRLDLPRLSEFGVGEADIPRIVAGSRNNSMKSNPVDLSDEEIAAIVRKRL